MIGLMKALRDSEVVASRFPLIDLGTAQSKAQESFQVICRPPAAKEEGAP